MFPEITKTNIFLIKIVFSQVFDFIPNAVLNIVNILLLLLLLVVVVVVVVVVGYFSQNCVCKVILRFYKSISISSTWHLALFWALSH